MTAVLQGVLKNIFLNEMLILITSKNFLCKLPLIHPIKDAIAFNEE